MLVHTEGPTAYLQHQPLSRLSKVLIPTPSFLGLGFYSVSSSAFSFFPSTVFLANAILKTPEQRVQLFSNEQYEWTVLAGVGGAVSEKIRGGIAAEEHGERSKMLAT